MKTKYISVILFLVSLLLIVFGYILSTPEMFGICYGGGSCFDQSVLFGVGHPLYLSLYSLPVLFFGLTFVKEEVFSAWAKVALPIGIIFLLIILWAPPLPDLLTPDRTWITKQLSLFFVLISALVVAYKYWILRTK